MLKGFWIQSTLSMVIVMNKNNTTKNLWCKGGKNVANTREEFLKHVHGGFKCKSAGWHSTSEI